MTIEKTIIQDLVISPKFFEDSRVLFEAYNQAKFRENGINYQFMDNQSFSKRGVIRGLHLQINPLLKLN
jgi:dTDP-4-dehydrorhamnose 3,5-epimerase